MHVVSCLFIAYERYYIKDPPIITNDMFAVVYLHFEPNGIGLTVDETKSFIIIPVDWFKAFYHILGYVSYTPEQTLLLLEGGQLVLQNWFQ